MKRRDLLLTAGAAALAGPRLGRAQGANVLRFIPQIDLAFLDPHFTTAYITRGHGHMVFDTLYGCDAQLHARIRRWPPAMWWRMTASCGASPCATG